MIAPQPETCTGCGAAVYDREATGAVCGTAGTAGTVSSGPLGSQQALARLTPPTCPYRGG